MDVHPIADIFPMMPEDELDDLAADIAQNGLIHPIVLDDDGRIVDGRNRFRACEKAGVEPSYASLNGHDAAAFIVSANLARRNLTKGQQAMVLAMIYPEPEKGGRGK
jgi:ParB-like chromosome segregation protein Spo0J